MRSWMIGLVIGLSACCTAQRPAPAPMRPPVAPSSTNRVAPAAATSKPAPIARHAPPPCRPHAELAWPEVPLDGPHDHPVPAIQRVETLAPFFEQLRALVQGKRKKHLRIAMYGDSNLTMDYVSGQLRRRLQARFGDGGHGFVALGKPWSHYRHMDIRHGTKGVNAFACSTDPALDQVYGISGISGESLFRGAHAWVSTSKNQPLGERFNRIAVYYSRRPSYGRFRIEVDGQDEAVVDTNGPAGVGIHRIEVADAPHDVRFVADESQRAVRWLGATFERSEGSVIVDSFGVGSMNTRSQARQDPKINKPMLIDRAYDLVIFATGANDGFSLHDTPKHLADLIQRHRVALPNAPILLLTPADRGRKRTFKPTRDVVKQRYNIAKDNNVALWDLWQAMGGESSMRPFKNRGFAHNDYVHFTQAGGAYLGDRLLRSLWTSFGAYLQAHPDSDCTPVVSAPKHKSVD